MRNILTLLFLCAVFTAAILKGMEILGEQGESRPHNSRPEKSAEPVASIPYIGRIQVLNGCGGAGSARIVAGYLREKKFDVKQIGNAENWNFPRTLVISRTLDTTIATAVADALGTDNRVLIRNGDEMYDVTVIVGLDYRELIE